MKKKKKIRVSLCRFSEEQFGPISSPGDGKKGDNLRVCSLWLLFLSIKRFVFSTIIPYSFSFFLKSISFIRLGDREDICLSKLTEYRELRTEVI